MIKECKVLSWNELVMVIAFDGIQIQMPSTKVKEKIVYVKSLNGIYTLVSKDEYDKSLIKSVQKEVKKEINNGDE